MADNRMRVWFALFVLAVFCLGGAAGIFVGARMERPARAWRGGVEGRGPDIGSRGGAPAGPPPGVMLERLTRQLDLDQVQREQVRAVLESSRERLEGLQREARERFGNEQRTLREEIRKVLTPEQRERFERSLERRQRGRGAR